MKPSILFVFVLLLGPSVSAQTFSSGSQRVTLLELFTSQGCSSCPPAERWLDRHVDEEKLWTQIVPVVWHVDYWDRLGWPDPFAKEAYTHRQGRYKLKGAIGSIYTPCFVANGQEWRGFFHRTMLMVYKEDAPELRAELDGGSLTVTLSPATDEYTLHRAIVESGQVTDVLLGENRGRSLEQNFVVIDHDTFDTEDATWNLTLPDWGRKMGARYALALWVTRSGEQGVLQAVGGWLQ